MLFRQVGVESFLRGNLQVQFGGRRASTQPYEYSDYNSSDEQSLTFDSYTIPEDDPELGQSRLLEVDNRVVVPAKTHLRIIMKSADVPHSGAVPGRVALSRLFRIVTFSILLTAEFIIGGGEHSFLSTHIAECAGPSPDLSLSLSPSGPINQAPTTPPEGGGNTSGLSLNRPHPLPAFLHNLPYERAIEELPPEWEAPRSVKEHVRRELRGLFNIGRQREISDRHFESHIEPLGLENCSMKGAKAISDRAVQLKYELRGNPLPFKTKAEREKLYSVVFYETYP